MFLFSPFFKFDGFRASILGLSLIRSLANSYSCQIYSNYSNDMKLFFANDFSIHIKIVLNTSFGVLFIKSCTYRLLVKKLGSFSFPPHTFKRKQTQHKGLYLTISFNISSNKSFPLFCCLHTIRVVFRLNKTLFTHFD